MRMHACMDVYTHTHIYMSISIYVCVCIDRKIDRVTR